MLPDGKIWGMDERIVSMDTNLASLPAPLPDWFAAWDWNSIRLGVVLVQLCISLAFLWYQRRRAFRKKQ